LGGGTFDVSVLEVGEGVFEVKSTAGDTHLGGDDFDQKIIDYLADEFKKENGVDLRTDRQALQRLRDAAEKAKIELSSSQEAEISIPFITATPQGPLHLQKKISRPKLEQLVMSLVDKSFKAVQQVLDDAKLKPVDIAEIVLVGGMTRMPLVQNRVKEFFGKEPHKGVNPDEVVAVGAAIQAGVLSGEVKEVVLLDVTPLTLGIETLGSVATPMIERNSTIPTGKTQIFSTAADNQDSVEVHVVQGERPLAHDNKSLGKFILSGIPPAPRGVPQIEVSFDIDANGILKVSAKDKATNKEQVITITATTALSKDEVEKMKKEAQEHEKEDKEHKEKIEAKNLGDNLCYTAEKTLRDAGDKVSADVKKEVEEKVKALRDVLETASTEDLKNKTQELSQVLQKVGAAMYQQNQPPVSGDQKPAGDGSNQASTDQSKVQEGEIVEEEKKD